MANHNKGGAPDSHLEAVLIGMLECSKRQLELATLDREREDFLSLFDRTVQEWNAFTQQLEEIQIGVGITESENIASLLREIASSIDSTTLNIENSSAHVGTNLKQTRSQRKLMNAYYGMANTDQVPLYFDEKK
ncbi:hypothetical protein [Paenibacillus stellifer]|uniref:hypothetical protein n=1 Tax=Paenibacillus stellifer TaxID=169760 RepID=UPI001470865E|nr:hypothetical protein [Paenibacillus stellifer]